MSTTCGIQQLGTLCKIKSYLAETEQPDLSPEAILKKLNENETIGKIVNGIKDEDGEVVRKINIKSKYQEGLSAKGTEAVAVVQEGLIALGLIKVDTCKKCWWTEFNFGVYGDQTIKGIADLQKEAGIHYLLPGPGQMLGPETVRVLKAALEAQAEGKDWRAEVNPK